jgi:hypothetical protein
MERRDFPRSAGTKAASGCPIAASPVVAAASDRPQWNAQWRSYRRGAFNEAVERVGGTVQVPPGTYLLTGVVRVHRSRVAIRGAGRGRTRRPVADPSVFRPGEHVLLLVDDTPDTTDNTLFAHLSGDIPGAATHPWETAAKRLRPEPTDWPLAVNFARYRFPVRVHRVERDAVVRVQPPRTDHPKDFTGELPSAVDALDEAVLPANLHEAQLRHRSRGPTQERGDA